jgi:tape measure domain-containing protein
VADKLTWTFELLDKMSGPAKRIAGALKALDFDKVKKAVGSFAEKLGAVPSAIANEFRPLGRALAFALEPLANVGRRAFDAVASRAGAAGSAIVDRLRPVGAAVMGRLSTAASAVADRFGSMASSAGQRLAPLATAASSVFSAVAARVAPVLSTVRNAFSSIADKVRPIATRIGSVFSSIGARLKPVGVELGKLAMKWGGGLAKAVGGLVGKVAGSAGSALLKLAPTLGKGLAAVGGAMVALGVAATAAVGGLAFAGGQFIAHALVFKEDSLTAFEAILGSKAEADKVMAMATKFASKTPFKTSEVVDMAKGLLTRGFKADELEKLMMGVGDVGAALGTDKMESVISALGKMRAKGKMTGEAMEMLSDAGVSQKLVFESLAKTLGKSSAEVQKMMSAGQITDAQGVAAVMDAIAKGLSGGELGGMMEKKSKTLSGLLSTLESVPEELVFSANMDKALGPLKQFVQMLTAALSPDSANGKRIIAIVEGIGKTFGDVVGQLTGGDIAGFIGKILNLVEPLVKVFAAFGAGAFKGLASVLGAVVAKLDKMDPKTVEVLVEAFATFGMLLGGLVGVIATFIGAMLALEMAVVTFFMSIFEWGKSLVTEMGWSELGAAIVQGIISGVTSMFGALGDSLGGAANAATSGFTNALGIASPSKVFEQLGIFTGQGFIQGILGSGIGDVVSQVLGAFAPGAGVAAMASAIPGLATPAAGTAGGPVVPGSAAGNGPVTVNPMIPSIQIIVNEAEKAAEAGKQAADSFTTQLGSALKGLFGESGG